METYCVSCKKNIANNDSKSHLGYLNKLVDKYNDSYHCSVSKKPNDADYSALTEKMNRVIKLLNLKLVIESGLPSTRIFLAKVTTKIGQD